MGRWDDERNALTSETTTGRQRGEAERNRDYLGSMPQAASLRTINRERKQHTHTDIRRSRETSHTKGRAGKAYRHEQGDAVWMTAGEGRGVRERNKRPGSKTP